MKAGNDNIAGIEKHNTEIGLDMQVGNDIQDDNQEEEKDEKHMNEFVEREMEKLRRNDARQNSKNDNDNEENEKIHAENGLKQQDSVDPRYEEDNVDGDLYATPDELRVRDSAQRKVESGRLGDQIQRLHLIKFMSRRQL